MVAFVLFIIAHVSLVVAHGFGEGIAKIVLGGADQPRGLATVLGLVGIGIVIVFHIAATRYSLRYPRKVKTLLEVGIDPLRTVSPLDAPTGVQSRRLRARERQTAA